ncbi:TPA: conjugal transfer protein [Stenotrophomonas maltophilia]|nr:conjugal transfer protein [Stenotrophomonas maltophilia]HDS0951643.1 conjugal transfer protein [Stenotrophomonas maltophilia]HDS1024167.1 conjugal transfer protein [Stenotrophomonas maltophilia]HDS1028121.1 conjugal transfer protein [Stenotrophomonas maltophilia]HDS1028338.1 conjugal transfer protein [Stenotrophomonas maltophilia]
MDQQDAAERVAATPYTLGSGARELLKWLALVMMTGDHVAKVVFGGYLPVASELGRVAFPLFALVMACNLAQPGADLGKSIRRLLFWGVIAQPVHALAFGGWLPVNILLSFVVAALVILALERQRAWLLLLAGGVLPAFVDYQWIGVAVVVLGWIGFRRRLWWLPLLGLAALCWHNGNGWALLSVPVLLAVGRVRWTVPRWRWAFYVYYVGHLALLAAYAQLLR